MKSITFTIVLMALSACTATQAQPATQPPATDVPQAGIPNPASVYCTKQGNKLQIHTAADGSQYGTCVALDGSTCDEWAYYRGECDLAAETRPTPAMTVEATAYPSAGIEEGASGGYMQPGTTEEIAGWSGIIKRTEPGSQYDDYFERQDLGQPILFGIDSADPAVQAQIKALRDTGTPVRLYGTLLSNVPDYNGSQILVARVELQK